MIFAGTAIITVFRLSRKDHCVGSLDHALLRVKVDENFRSRDLIRSVMNDRRAGHLHRAIGLVEDGLLPGRVATALIDLDIAKRGNFLDLVHTGGIGITFRIGTTCRLTFGLIRAVAVGRTVLVADVDNRKRIADKCGSGLYRMHVALEGHVVALVVEIHRVGLDVDRSVVGGEAHGAERIGVVTVLDGRCGLGP